MTGIAPVTPRQSFSLAPQNLTEAMKFAEMMAESELVPKQFKGKPGDVLIAVQMGNEVGLAPMAAIQNIAVINGKPGIYGDAGKAILLAAGCIIEEDDIEAIKKNGMARCRITRNNRPPVERTFSVENAKTAGLFGKEGPWRTYPERQMAWRAFWFAARDAAADLLKGLGGAEELVDIEPREINPMPARQTGTQAAEAARKASLPAPTPERDNLIKQLNDVVTQRGLDAYAEEWSKLTAAQRKLVGAEEHGRLKSIGEEAKRGTAQTVGAPVVTFAQVADKLQKAEDMDLLDVAADLIGEVQDAGQREELQALYRERQAQIVGAK